MINPNNNSNVIIVTATEKTAKEYAGFYVDGDWNEDEYAVLEFEVDSVPVTVTNVKPKDKVFCHRFVALHQSLMEKEGKIYFYAEPAQVFARIEEGGMVALNGISICTPIVEPESEFDLLPQPKKDKAICVSSDIAEPGTTLIYQISADKPFTIGGVDYLFVDNRFVFAVGGAELVPRNGVVFIAPVKEGISDLVYSKTKVSNFGEVINSTNPDFPIGCTIIYKPKAYNKIEWKGEEYIVANEDQIYGTVQERGITV